MCFVHAVCSVLDTWYYSTHDRCAWFLIPYRIVVLTIHCFHCCLAPETKVAVLTRSSHTVVCDLQLDTFFWESLNIVSVICNGALQCDMVLFFQCSSIGHLSAFGLWRTWQRWRTDLLCTWDVMGRVFILWRSVRAISCRSCCSRDCLTSVLRHENSTGQKSANDL